ncbi:MAG: MBL fold metallo-hydrolase [Desulfobulbaceae bacterium]|nr:MBL fold metallo-hydrolase [Desulfobulbaceae bacterium]
MSQPTITHLGGENCVTGSCHLLQAAGLNIMVDCGVAQGNDDLLPMADWPVPAKEIDYLFLTHAHIDHIGRLPELMQNGFAGEIICSHPTKALLIPMLTDAMGFGQLEAPEIKKLSDRIDELSWGFEYQQEFKLKHGVCFKLGRAGHILGSAFIRFTIPVNDKQNYAVLFSGDLGNKDTPIIPDPDIPESCDLLILESTYGNRLHESREGRLKRLSEKLARALADNGKVFIPAFALGRTQEILYELDRLFSNETWQKKRIPVFVDSPLALEITRIYSDLSSFWDSDAKKLQAAGDHPFDFAHLYSVERFKDHKAIFDIPGPAIIIAGSGMCTGGRIIDHLHQGLADPRNDVFFVGYQSPGTSGYDIVKYGKQPGGYVFLDNEKVFIRANVEQLTGYSAHADQQGLLEWVESMPEKPGRIKLVHGDPAAQEILCDEFVKRGYNVFMSHHP